MKTLSEGMLLRVFVGESDILDGKPLYEQIVLEARRRGLAGATVIRGVMGFGANSCMHSAKILRMSHDLPVVVELVDSKDNIDKILSFLDEHVSEGLVTLEKVRIVQYRHNVKEKA